MPKWTPLPLTFWKKCLFVGTMSLFLAIVIGLSYYILTDQTESPPSSWKRFEVRAYSGNVDFSFAAPKDFDEHEVQGIDSAVGRYNNLRIFLSYDLGSYSNDLSDLLEEEGYERATIEVEGRKGQLVTSDQHFPYYAGVAFRDIHGEGIHLMVSAEAFDRKAHAVAVEILKSIRFEK